jgi:agmatine deiminase
MISALSRWPAEWELHEATWIAWPHNAEDWPGKFEPIPWVYVEIVKHLHRVGKVRILATEETQKQATAMLQRAGVDGSRIEFFSYATDRVWTRDFAPIFVKDAEGNVLPVKWRFNAWAKYDNWQQDDAAGRRIAEKHPAQLCPQWHGQHIVLEGGSVETNGQDTMLTTEECLLSPVQARNPHMSRADLEKAFLQFLGIRKVLWLNRGIDGDDTHGHIDDLARFVTPDTVVVVQEEDKNDPNYEPLRENWERLQSMTTADGRKLRVLKLPMPSPVWFDGQRLPASYANFYVTNRLVMVPVFHDPMDRHALNLLAEAFPGRDVVGIFCGDLVWGLGTLHCMTMQEPAAGH